MMLKNNIRMAMQSIRSSRWRSFLTMVGVIIGIVSVVTIVSLGEGVKRQITNQITRRGPDLITVLPGKQVDRDEKGRITSYNPLSASGSVFTEADLEIVKKVSGDAQVVPFARVTGLPQTDDKKVSAQIIATTPNVSRVLGQDLQYGTFFSEEELNRDFAVIGRHTAEKLFNENVPIGKSFRIREQTFIVRGVFEEVDAGIPLFLTTDYNNAIFIPYQTGNRLVGGNAQIYQILVRPKDTATAEKLKHDINDALLNAHAGAEDFTVLKQTETLALANSLLNLLTGFISSIAAISLLVGGIGIMNIMFVSVSERTGEIGIRKSLGATNGQILGQFLIEATVISFVGGVFGVLLSILANFLIRITTSAQPVISLPVVIIATGVAFAVGTFFGVAPAVKAARKDPIEALRYNI